MADEEALALRAQSLRKPEKASKASETDVPDTKTQTAAPKAYLTPSYPFHFYRNGFRRLIVINLLLSVVATGLAFIIVLMSLLFAPSSYYVTTRDGKIAEIIPYGAPPVSPPVAPSS